MLRFKHLLTILLSVFIGSVFLYSAYSKLVPIIETFEFTFIDIGVANWYSAPVIARIIIASEIFTGLLFLIGFRLRKITVPLALTLLLLFTIYLGWQVWLNGDEGNCGCFGERIKMTPVQAILKNFILMILSIGVYMLSEGWHTRFQTLLLSLLGLISLTLPFVINPVDYAYTSNNLEEKINYPLDLELLYHPEDSSQVEIPKLNLRKGKHVLAFLSLTCSHCRIAAKKFKLIKKNNPELPVYFVLNGNKSDYPEFIKDTKTENIPSSFCMGKTFVQLSSAHLPRIYYINDGFVVKKADYFELSQYGIEEWIKTGKP